MNEERIAQSLTQYQGTQESLEKTVAVLSEELGPEWTTNVFERLGDLPVELKEKLNHVFNYYAALMAWQETQEYLNQQEPFDESIHERLPVLKHWLEFFGEPGTDLYQQLENKLQSGSESPSESDETVNEEVKLENDEPTVKEEEAEEENVSEENTTEEVTEKQTPSEQQKIDLKTPEAFALQKAKNEIELLDNVQAWLSARCLQLNNMEVFAYPYYGFAVDLMRQTVKDIQAVLDLKDKTVLESYDGGEEAIIRKKQAIEADIETAVQNCESATTALIDENINMDDVRKTLGDLDENPEPEYLGPAPDGFELIDNTDAPLDENALKEQYQKLEKEVLAENENTSTENTSSEKKTSQTNKNSVQRKLSFSLKPKK